MVDNVLGLSTKGLRDWIVQRITAVLLGIYTLYIFIFLIFHSPLQFEDWQGLFANTAFKIFSFLVLFSTLLHAWVGMWTVFTDYIKCAYIRLILQTLVIILFFSCLIWGALILWSI